MLGRFQNFMIQLENFTPLNVISMLHVVVFVKPVMGKG
jgi:hypothetical protein